MAYNILDILSFKETNRGDIKVDFCPGGQLRLYKMLNDWGYGQAKINKKNYYFLREEDSIRKVSFLEIRDAFWDFLETISLSELPESVTRHDLLEWYLTVHPVKKNFMASRCLTKELTDEEVHRLRMTEAVYSKEYKINSVLKMLKDHGFKQTTDSAHAIYGDGPVYYKRIGLCQFLLFGHINAKRLVDSCFCVCLAAYPNENEVGKLKQVAYSELHPHFELDRDFDLIRDYLEL